MPIETVPIHRAQWTDLVLRMRIPSRRKTVAFALAKFANADGSRVFPGQGKVADMAGLHETNARTHIRALVSVGMLTVVKRGGGRGGATTTYRLSRPADITTLPLWLDPEMNRIEEGGGDGPEEHRASALDEGGSDAREQQPLALGDYPKQKAPALGGSVDNPAENLVDNSETQSADAPHSDAPADEIPSDTARNTERYGEKYRAIRREIPSAGATRPTQDLPKTNPTPRWVTQDDPVTCTRPPDPQRRRSNRGIRGAEAAGRRLRGGTDDPRRDATARRRRLAPRRPNRTRNRRHPAVKTHRRDSRRRPCRRGRRTSHERSCVTMPRSRSKPPAELRPGVIGILSRPGGIEDQADEICALVARLGKQAAAAPVQRCQNPDDPHTGTALVGGRCPICGWSPTP